MMYRARGYFSGSLNGVPFRFDPYHSKFWRKATEGKWEPGTFAVLDAHLDRDHDYLDIGAWIGPTVLYAARKARHVWCFEPDPEAFRALVWNIALNDLNNVSAFAAALSQAVGVARMAGFHGEKGDSTTSLLNADGTAGSDVLTLDFAQFANSVSLDRVSLVKLDVEGAEFDLLPTLTPWLTKQRPGLLLSTHAPFLSETDRRQRMADLVAALEFYPRWQDETGQDIAPQTLFQDAELRRFRTVLLSG
jgi:FkbM family methyltransferase